MDKKLIAILLIICILFSITLFSVKQYANADALTLSMIGAASFALMNDWGISLTAGSATSSGMSDFMSEKLTTYVNVNGGSITDLFGAELARDVAGKLVVGHSLYNGVKNFVTWLGDTFGLTNSDTDLTQGEYNDVNLPYSGGKSDNITGVGYEMSFSDPYNLPNGSVGYGAFDFYYNGTRLKYNVLGLRERYLPSYIMSYNASSYQLIVTIPAVYTNSGNFSQNLSYVILSGLPPLDNSLSWNGSNYVEPTVLNPSKEWVGDFGFAPDINIDDLIDDIFEEVADNNLDVDGEIIDIGPTPTPIPVPTPVVDVIDGINTQIGQLDGIGNDIGDISGHLDDLGELAEDAVNALEGIQEGIDTQTGILGGIDTKVGSIDQTLAGTQDIVNDISDTLTDALDVPSAQESSDYKFDLSTLFPFCIPFDIARMLRAFDGVAAAPHFRIPINISSISFSYTMDLDFSMFDTLAALLRQVELIAFAIVLAFATSKVIRW